MSDPFDPELTEITQPEPEDVSFDLASVLSSVVYIRTKISTDAFTATSLGGERAGHGVVIRDDGLVLTIGYLITEAQSVPGPTGDPPASTHSPDGSAGSWTPLSRGKEECPCCSN